jgi:hypothetical protein
MLSNDAALVHEVAVDEAVPVLEGVLPFAEGVYALTASTRYTGPGGSAGPTGVQHRRTLRLRNVDLGQGNALGEFDLVDATDGLETRSTGTFRTGHPPVGTPTMSLLLTERCPTDATLLATKNYAATALEITMPGWGDESVLDIYTSQGD